VMNIDNGFGAGCLAHRINVLGEQTAVTLRQSVKPKNNKNVKLRAES